MSNEAETKTAAEFYKEYSEDITILLDCMQSFLAAHKINAEPSEENWSCVGDLGHIRHLLICSLVRISVDPVEHKDIEELLLEGAL